MYDAFHSYDVTDYDPLEGDSSPEEGETAFTVNWAPDGPAVEPAAEAGTLDPPFAEEDFPARWWPSTPPENL